MGRCCCRRTREAAEQAQCRFGVFPTRHRVKEPILDNPVLFHPRKSHEFDVRHTFYVRDYHVRNGGVRRDGLQHGTRVQVARGERNEPHWRTHDVFVSTKETLDQPIKLGNRIDGVGGLVWGCRWFGWDSCAIYWGLTPLI